MAKIYPFRGIRYNPELINSFADVITPPYDVISVEKQNELYKKSDYNLIRLEYGYEFDEDTENNNRYTRAAETFQKWLSENILIRESEPAIYLYEQEFVWNDKVYVREGIVSTILLEPYEKKAVLPHEETLSKPKEDRLKILESCQANFSPIFGLYPDKEQIVKKITDDKKSGEPVLQFRDNEGQVHRLWKITDSSFHKDLHDIFTDWSVLLADGHHRFETALRFSEIMKEKNKSNFDRVLIFLFNLFDPDLIVLPTHRVIEGLKDFNVEVFLESLKEFFDIEEYGPADDSEVNNFYSNLRDKGKNRSAIGLCIGDRLYYLLLKENLDNDLLDVDILQKYIFTKTLNLTSEDISGGELLTYTRSEKEAAELVRIKNAQISFLLNHSPIEDVISYARKGVRLPQKSTYFYPKLISGLLINKLGE